MSAPSARVRPMLETLEGRDCPAVSATFADGILTVVGDDGPNRVAVFELGRGAVEVTGDGQRFEFSGVREVAVHTLAGPDRVEYGPRSAAAVGDLGGRPLTIDVGPGDDRVIVRDHPAGRLHPEFVFGVEMPVHIDLGTGGDYVLTQVEHFDDVELDVVSADGGDEVVVAMLLPAVQKVRSAEARIDVSLGAGGNSVTLATHNYDDVQVALKTSVPPGTAGPLPAERFALDFGRPSAGPADPFLLAAKLQAAIDLSDAADRLTLRTAGYPTVATRLASAGGDDRVQVRHRMFAVVDRTQLVFDAALGAGDDRLNLHAAGYDAAALSLDFGAGDDWGTVRVSLPGPKTELIRQVSVINDMGPGDDTFHLVARGYNDARATLNTGPDGEGTDRIAATFVLPGRPGTNRLRHLVSTHSMDLVRVLGVGYATADVAVEGSECGVFFLGGIPR